MIYYFKPFSTFKQVGEVYNAHCEIVPRDTDWIAIMDYDFMFLCPETFKVIEHAIFTYPELEIFGCMTNRVGYSYQRDKAVMDENADIRYHIARAQELATKVNSFECEKVPTLAGFFMLFQKKYWIENHFQDGIFDEKGNLFDERFCRSGKRRGTCAVIKGAYGFHQYRIMKEDYRDKSHLK